MPVLSVNHQTETSKHASADLKILSMIHNWYLWQRNSLEFHLGLRQPKAIFQVQENKINNSDIMLVDRRKPLGIIRRLRIVARCADGWIRPEAAEIVFLKAIRTIWLKRKLVSFRRCHKSARRDSIRKQALSRSKPKTRALLAPKTLPAITKSQDRWPTPEISDAQKTCLKLLTWTLTLRHPTTHYFKKTIPIAVPPKTALIQTWDCENKQWLHFAMKSIKSDSNFKK